MKPDEIAHVRSALSLTQAQLASLLGCHVLTISKWECGRLIPSPYQVALLRSFGIAQEKKPDIGDIASACLVEDGAVMAIYVLLKAALGD